jgi:ribonuclease E
MKEEAEEKVVEDEAANGFEIVPAASEEEKVGDATVTKEEVGVVPAVIEEKVRSRSNRRGSRNRPCHNRGEGCRGRSDEEEDGIVPAAIEEKVVEVEAKEEEVEIIPAAIEEKVVEVEATEEEVEIVPVTIEEKVVEVEAKEDEVEPIPAAIEEKVVEVEATEDGVEIGPAAAIEEKGIEAEPPQENLVVIDEPVVSPSVPVETEIPVLAEEEIAAAELVAPPIVEVEEAQLV